MRSNLIHFCSFLASLLLLQNSFAHAPHEHGTAKIDIGVQDTSATIHVEVPAMSFYGFEHEAKKAEDKKAMNAAVEKFKKNINQIVKLDYSLGCTFSPNKIDPFAKDDEDEDNNVKDPKDKKSKTEGIHGEFKAEYTIKCQKKISGSKVTFGFHKYFPNINSIQAQGLSDSSQAATKILNDKGFLQL